MALYGLDLSKHQSTSTVGQAKDFVIIKATEGAGYVDPTCDTKYQYAKKKGKLLGVYHFARPDLNSATAEADFFIKNIKGYVKEAILVLDWETGNTKNVAWALTWLERVESKTGVKPLIYMSASVIRSADWSPVAKANFGLWVAGYPPKYNVKNPSTPAENEMPYNIKPWPFAAIWQYSSSAGTLDRNIAHMTKDAWIKYAGKVATPKEKPSEPTKSSPKPPQQTTPKETTPPAQPPVAEPAKTVDTPKKKPVEQKSDNPPVAKGSETQPQAQTWLRLVINILISILKNLFRKS